jgi:lysophospholipase L1-like esterase
VVGLVEIGLRLGGVGAAYDPSRLGRWQTTPNLVNHQMVGTREPHDFRLSTNADGLRTDTPRARTEGRVRIALMGDSNVFGWGLDNAETLAAQTERKMRSAGHDVEIINAGQPGYSTAQATWLFGETLQHYTPDLTIVFLSMHDHNRVLVSDKEIWQGADGPARPLQVFLARHSRIYEALRRRLYPMAHEPQVMPDELGEGARVPRVSDRERRDLLDGMLATAQAHGGEIGLGLMPDVADLRQGAVIPRLGQVWAEAWTAEHGMPMFNLRACCTGHGEAFVFPFDKGHMNVGGNAKTAIALAEALELHLR